jgi:hypothetical protein
MAWGVGWITTPYLDKIIWALGVMGRSPNWPVPTMTSSGPSSDWNSSSLSDGRVCQLSALGSLGNFYFLLVTVPSTWMMTSFS